MRTRVATGASVFVLLGGCNNFQTALGGDGADGAHFVSLFSIFLVVCLIMYVLVVGALFMALRRGRNRADPLTVEAGKQHDEPPPVSRTMVGWGGLILLGLLGLTIASFFTDRSNAAAAKDPRLLIRVTANQWWWDARYETGAAAQHFRTANELHLPIGVPVEVTLQSTDVIHSFWVPNLAGKQDLIPGRVTDVQLVPNRIGTYRGQCAEFCGIQHANMALTVTVESRADFLRWAAAQQRVAFAPTTPVELAGYRYFTTRQCSSCHAIGGTKASAAVAPDLTHLASRNTLAAGTLPMTRANLRRWIADPQAVKPGNNMPTIPMAPGELDALTAFLARLK